MTVTAILLIQGIILILLLMLSAFFSSSETALFSLNPLQISRLIQNRPQAGRRVEQLLNTPTRLLSTILIGNTIVNVTSASLGYALLENMQIEHAGIVAVPAMTILLLIFGEVIPKRVAVKHAAGMSALYSRPLLLLTKVMAPLRFALERSAAIFVKDLNVTNNTLTEDEFLTVVEVGEEEGILDEEERTMVDGIIRLEGTRASDVMTPRVDLTGIDLNDSPQEHEAAVRGCLYRYLPLYRDNLDNIEGFLDVPRFLLSETRNIFDASIAAFFVPETIPLDTLLTMFQKENRKVAIVSDEFGGTAGLITRGDILEEIADDVDNEFGQEEFEIQKVGDNRWFVDGSTSLEDINYELDMNLEAEGADRIAGWVAAYAEHIPRPGEVVEAQGCRATVQIVRRQRIMSVMLEKLEPQPPEGDES